MAIKDMKGVNRERALAKHHPSDYASSFGSADFGSPSQITMPVLDFLPTKLTTPIYQFVCQCLQGKWDPVKFITAQQLTRDDRWDWQEFRQMIYFENLAPLLYQRLRHQAILPEPLLQEFGQAYYQNACRNSLLLKALAEILTHCQKQGIDVIVLKGAAIGELVYGDIAVRPMSDLDVLISPQHLPQVREILNDLGFHLTGFEMHTGYAEDFRNEETWAKPGLIDVLIDLHWGLFNRLYYHRTLSIGWLWKNAQFAQLNGVPSLVLTHEIQIVYLCAHLLLHHDGQGMVWLADIAELINLHHATIDWLQVLNYAQTDRLVIPVQRILPQLAQHWQVPIPAFVLNQLLALQPSIQEVRLFRCLTARHLTLNLRLFLADLIGAANWQQRLRFAWNTLFPTQFYMQQRYQISSPWLTLLYYPYRWLRAFRDFSRS